MQETEKIAKVLIVDDDQSQHILFDTCLQKYKNKFSVIFSADGEEAMTILERETVSLLVTDIKMPKVDGFALLAHMASKYPEVPCIVLTSYSIPGLQKSLLRKVFRVLEKPVDPVLLAGLIKRGIEQAKRVEAFSEISMSGLMQVIESEKKTCLLSIHIDGRKQGLIYFNEGALYDAVYGELKGEDAAIQLIGMDDVQIHHQKLGGKKFARKIHKGTQALILKAMKLKDETAAKSKEHGLSRLFMQSELLDEGIRLCEGLHFKKAQKPLLELVQNYPGNAQGWLWLSRAFSSLEKIKIAMTKAYNLDPQHPTINSDIKKIRSSAKLDLGQVRRCPFCYTPLDPKVLQCHFCKSYLTVNIAILSDIGKVTESEELGEALERYNRVLARELNLDVLFYAGLACLNLNNFDGVLQYHEQLQQCFGPGSEIYKPAVERIVMFIASKSTLKENEVSLPLKTKTQVLPAASGNKKVLVVEDSPTIRKVIKMTLRSNNFDVVEAADGVEALSKLNDEEPDLILLDVMLPKLDGYGVLSVIKQNKNLKDIPVIMLTSKDSLKDKLKGRFSTANAYLTKPFQPAMLIKEVNKYIL